MWDRLTAGADRRTEVHVGFSAPGNGYGTPLYGVPVLLDASPAWPTDEWVYVVDGVKVAGGYGRPDLPALTGGM